jgi:hypothetical protein
VIREKADYFSSGSAACASRSLDLTFGYVGSEQQLAQAGAADRLSAMLDAIGAEIEAASGAAAGRSFELSDGRRLYRSLSGALYSFTAEIPVSLPPETPIQLREGGGTLRGVLIAVDDFTVLIQLDEDRGESISSASIETTPAFILEALRDCILESLEPSEELPGADVVGTLTGTSPVLSGSNRSAATEGSRLLTQLDDDRLVPNAAQLLAMARVAGSSLHFVWGPPGTGKTASVAQVARTLVAAGERVLVVANANVAVDVAMLRIADAFAGTSELSEGKIIRLGTPQLQEAANRDKMLVDGILARVDPSRTSERRDLETRRRQLTTQLRADMDDGARDDLAFELAHIRSELTRIRAEQKQAEDDLLNGAVVVGATLSRLVLSRALWSRPVDAVLLDEASMISVPWVIAAATRASKRLAIFGDFRQLPPVHLAESANVRRWLGRDAFDLLGVRARVDTGDLTDERVTLLDTQYRMAKPIGEAVSELAYLGRLKTDPDAAERSGRLAAAAPHPGTSLLLVDTSQLRSACQVEAAWLSFSRVNPLHALLSLSLLDVVESSAALISPYRAQARLLAAGVRDRDRLDATAATIHRFQGSERDVVIFDLVDALPQDRPSRLTGSDVDLALRLVNVGLSRAKGKAIVVADVELIENRFGAGAPVRHLVDLCRTHGTVIAPTGSDVADAFAVRTIDWVEEWEAFEGRLLDQLARTETSLALNVPASFDSDGRLTNVLLEIARRGVAVSVRGSRDLVRELEESSIELSLLPRPGFLCCIDKRTAYVAGREPTIGAIATGLNLPRLLETAVFGDDRLTRSESQPIAASASGLASQTRELPQA